MSAPFGVCSAAAPAELERTRSMPRVIEDILKNRMRPEFELVLCSARPKTFENDQRIKAIFEAGVNWSEMLACAVQHKLTPVLYECVRDLNAGWLPQGQRDTLTELARTTVKSNLAFLIEMLRLHGAFEAAQIPAIPFKGPAL